MSSNYSKKSKLCIHILAATLLLSSFGCSTIITRLTGPNWKPPDKPLPQVYSGTLFDLRCVFKPSLHDTEGLGPFCFIDVPFSLIGDTVILPLTIYDQLKYGSYGTFLPAETKKEEGKEQEKTDENNTADDKQAGDNKAEAIKADAQAGIKTTQTPTAK